MDMESMLNFSYLDMAKAIIDRFNDLIRLSERLFPFHDGDTPLLFAVRRNTGNVEVIKKLLDMGEDINVVNEDGRNVLHEAVMNAYCSHKLVKTVLEKEPSLVNRPDRLNKTALHMAMMFDNNEDVVNELLNRGADINAKDLYFETPLHIAANFKYNLFSILLKRGAEIDPRNCYVRTPLHCALMRKSPHLNIPLIRALLSHGANVQAADRGGNSVLHYTIRNREIKIEIVKLLLEHGAIPDCTDQRKFPPLGYCVNKDIAELLIQYTVMSNFNAYCKLRKNEMIVADQMLSLQWCKNSEDRERYIKYRDTCLVNLVRMTTDKISNTQSFYDFVSARYNKIAIDKSSQELVPDVVLIRFFKNTYPACKDIVSASLKREELLKRLFHQPIYTNRSNTNSQGNRKTVFLNPHCVDHLASYLSKLDIIHLLLAYLNPDLQKNRLPRSTVPVVVKRKNESRSIYFLVCKRLKINVIEDFNYETGAKFLSES